MVLPRRQLLRCGPHTTPLFRRGQESERHLLMKAALWARYVEEFPDAKIEGRVGDRYSPDVVAVDSIDGSVVLWCEAGQVTPRKVERVARRFRDAHVVIAKWGGSLGVYEASYRPPLRRLRRNAPVELLVMPSDPARYLDESGVVTLDQSDVQVSDLCR